MAVMNKENVKLKVILYFLIGVILNFLGLIIGGLWIKFKAKTNQKTKFIALIAGFGVFALFSYVISPNILEPYAEKALYSQYPEMQTVKTTLQNKYTDGKIGLGANWNKTIGAGQEKTTSTLSVQFNSKRMLSKKEMQDMGQLVCNTLQPTGKKYDLVGVASVKSFLPVDIPGINANQSYRIVATCEEWATEDFSNTKSPI